MAFLIGGANSAADTGYTVANSCRFNDGDSAEITRTLGTPTNADKFTLSMWVKRGIIAAAEMSLFVAASSDSQGDLIRFTSGDAIEWQMYHGGATAQYITNRKFRDPSAWYHLVFTYDSGNATAGDRMKIYVNGVEETSFATSTDVAVNTDSKINSAIEHSIGQDGASGISTPYFDGYMAEVVLCDGQTYAASDFGEFDEDSPTIWKPKDVSGLTFGTNGCYLDFEASDNLGNDANGGTDWSETNIAATDQSISTPTNIFPTFTPLVKSSYVDIAEGNRLLTGNTASDGGTALTTMPSLTKGKWYIESKSIDDTGQMPQGGFHFNMATTTMYNVNGAAGFSSTGGFGWNSSGGVESTLFTDLSGLTSGSDGDVKQYAWDMDNGAFYIGINNTWQNSGNPESGASKTGSVFSFTPADYPNIGFSSSGFNGSDEGINFGDPHYANTSDAADADGYGKFEFAPPSGYFSLCTKNLAEYG